MSAGEADDHHTGPMQAFAVAVRDAVLTGEVADGVPTFADGLACDEVLDRLRAAPGARRLRFGVGRSRRKAGRLRAGSVAGADCDASSNTVRQPWRRSRHRGA